MVKSILFLGVGGIGMSSLAKYMLNKGYKVYGYDRNFSELIKKLENLGMNFVDAEKIMESSFISKIDLIVRTSAIKENADILKESKRQNVPVIKRSKLLGQICSFGHQICLAGTHGKTTTTSMTSKIFETANLKPTVFVGGEMIDLDDNFLKGNDNIFVVEADEYDRSFHDLRPRIGGITNIEEDHLDIYKNLQDIKESFMEFASKIPFYGCLILPSDLSFIQEFKKNMLCKVETFGFSEKSNWTVKNIKKIGFSVKFDVKHNDEFYTTIELPTIGEHNILDALIAIAVSYNYGIDKKSIKTGLKNYQGVKRRLQKLGNKKNVLFLDDYAHHPSEISATLTALKANVKQRIVTIFQPHLFSRTRDFYEEFAKKLSIADYIILTEIYPAREKPIENVNSKMIADLIEKDVVVTKDKNELFDKINEIIQPNDIVISLGAGTISKWMHEFYEKY